MPALPVNNSPKFTSYSQLSSNYFPKTSQSFRLKQYCLRKSMFNSAPGLA